MPDGFFPFSFGLPDEEMRRKAEEQHEEHMRSALDFQHTLEEAWTKLNFDELYAVAQWLDMLSSSPVEVIRSRLSYHSGSLFRLASQRGDKCMVCDKNHNEEVERLRVEAEAEGSGVREFHNKEETESEADPNNETEAAFQESQRIIAEHEAKVKEYRLQQDFDNGGFNCIHCGMKYATLEDRMLKEPGIEGCPGCIHKTKFG